VEVLVVGAGPTGLALALQAHDHGARIRIVERRATPVRPSRALIVHPRTLEQLRPLGVTERLLAGADLAPEALVHIKGSKDIRVRLGDLALHDTPFPHLTLVRQQDVETVLSEALENRGVRVEWGTEVVEVTNCLDSARATLRSSTGIETIECRFIAGCDGPESTVRRAAAFGWHGRPYREEVVLADAELDPSPGADLAHVVVGRPGVVLALALGECATWRLLVTRPAGPGRDRLAFGQPGPGLGLLELQTLLDDAGFDARITSLGWSARFSLQHRLARRFRQGQLYLVGDAAHAFSPATGQGMNTGIQDALNLGWKLAFAATATDGAVLLDSYQRERRPVARRVLALTHLVFWAEAGSGLVPALLRGVVAPLGAPLLPAVVARRRLVALAIRCVSQLRVGYPHRVLATEGSEREPSGMCAGQRLPDATATVNGRRIGLHALLAAPGIHVLLARDAPVPDELRLGRYVTVHRLTGTPGTGVVAVRPDGYLGYCSGRAHMTPLRTWLARVGAGPR
jgi:2-polyprenyl-6-methoxyphenol hydroxylase-like FAD-dependent oxidoreductase